MNNNLIFIAGFILGYNLRPLLDIIYDVINAIFTNAWRNYKADKNKSIEQKPLDELRTNNTEPQFKNTKPIVKYKEK